MSKAHENRFQQDIIDDLKAQGWVVGESKNYNREYALYPEDVLGYFQSAWPKRWEKFARNNPNASEESFLRVVARQLDKHGALNVLRHGFSVPGTKVGV